MLFAGSIIVYVAWQWDDTSLAETLVLGAFALWGTVVGAYAGFATWEDTKLGPRKPRNPDERYDDDEFI